MNKFIGFGLATCISLFSCSAISALKGSEFVAPYSKQTISVNGQADDDIWHKPQWYPLFENMLGSNVEEDDFSGQFKLAWDESYLYLLVEITDDILFDQHADPLYFYWDDDCLEVFIDEDKSGGDHLFNYNAFAYHVALDNQVVDMGEKVSPDVDPFILLNDHVNSVWKRSSESPNKIIWEVAVKVFDDKFKPDAEHQPVKLSVGKELGFMLAYCDNDGSKNRESFIGSTEISPVDGDKNLGYKTADVFASLTLVK